MFRLVPGAGKHILIRSLLSQVQDRQSHTLISFSFMERECLDLIRKMAVESGEVGGGEVGCRSDGKGTAAGEAFAPASCESCTLCCTRNTGSFTFQSLGPLLLSFSLPGV
jgi:hypothetical protein